ncbi:MAG: zf-HC2 domain-containing protein [Anaeromyxobacteraceae bacterium]
MTSLGGPGVPCSAMRIRRLAAGELQGDERTRAEAHLEGCARCQATLRVLEAERVDLARALPFPAFAAGVADHLAAPAPRPRTAPRLALRLAPLALAAGLAAVVAVPLVRELRDRRDDPAPGIRTKGGATAELHVSSAAGARALAPGEPVPAGASLRVALGPAGHTHAAVALVDRDGPALVYAGPAVKGPLPGAFEWTGEGDGELVVVLDDRPIDGAALVSRLGASGVGAAAPDREAEVLVVPLTRGRR